MHYNPMNNLNKENNKIYYKYNKMIKEKNCKENLSI